MDYNKIIHSVSVDFDGVAKEMREMAKRTIVDALNSHYAKQEQQERIDELEHWAAIWKRAAKRFWSWRIQTAKLRDWHARRARKCENKIDALQQRISELEQQVAAYRADYQPEPGMYHAVCRGCALWHVTPR